MIYELRLRVETDDEEKVTDFYQDVLEAFVEITEEYEFENVATHSNILSLEEKVSH